MVQPLWRITWRFLERLKIELPYDPAIPLLGIHPEEIIFEKMHAPQCSLQGLFTAAKTWKQPKCPSPEEWIKKMYIYTVEY